MFCHQTPQHFTLKLIFVYPHGVCNHPFSPVALVQPCATVCNNHATRSARRTTKGARLLTMVGKLNAQLHPGARSTRESITPNDQNIWPFPVRKRERHCIKYIILS